ncbi:MAG: hypothetical protein M4579_006029 [Chaenotheca gracillima]|nr:MAG: hypothetical protein M4579_006029 [Chaenotheca gracillima]
MSSELPYTYIACPCSETFNSLNAPGGQLRNSGHGPSNEPNQDDAEDEQEERTFDPMSPRSAYSLYPLDQLLYCEDCHQIRCPRCVLEEIVCIYCPSCLFEVPSSLVKSEGNKYELPPCSRNCYNCPICTAPLAVSGLDTAPPTAEHPVPGGPWVLSCLYCYWSSREIDMIFEKPNNISGQLAKMTGTKSIWLSESERERKPSLTPGTEQDTPEGEASRKLDADKQFANLKSFYTTQLLEHAPNGTSSLGLPSSSYGYGSPGTLSRIMGMYTGVGGYGRKKEKGKTEVMREARELKEGIRPASSEDETIKRMREGGFDGVTTLAQRSDVNRSARFFPDLRPIPTGLRTKRSKRCRTCRHILVRPESKVASTRFRIKLLAQNYVPTLNLRPLHQPQASKPFPSQPIPTLTPLTPSQHLLTFTNPLFDPIRLTLATPSTTAGRFASKITILCPQFDVGANTDVWDEALSNTNAISAKAAAAAARDRSNASGAGNGAVQAEAGKIWERGRNWTSVVLETVPASLRNPVKTIFPTAEQGQNSGEDDEGDHIREDEDVLEIPLFVRVEYETEAVAGGGLGDDGGGRPGSESREKDRAGGVGGEGGAGRGAKEKRELAYWCVVGVGRIAG